MHVALLWHGEVSLVRQRPVWMTNHLPSVLWHCWLGHQTCKNIVSKMIYTVWSGLLNLTQLNSSQSLLCLVHFQIFFCFGVTDSLQGPKQGTVEVNTEIEWGGEIKVYSIPLAVSHSFTVLSMDPVAISEQSQLNWAELISARWPIRVCIFLSRTHTYIHPIIDSATDQLGTH